MSTSTFNLARLKKELKPFRLHWFSRLRSTNDHAALLRRRGDLYAPAVVLTGHQLAGRGRGSNTWWSGDGSLTVTFVIAVDEHLAPYHVPLIAGLAVRNAAAALAGDEELQLKWPNDLLHGGRKVAGLLCERIDKVDLVGVGLNVNIKAADVPPPLRSRVTSLNEIAGKSLEMTGVLVALAERLHRELNHRDEHSFAAVLRDYDRHHALMHRRVTVTGGPGEPAITGTCEGLDQMGRLLVRERATLHRIIAGHVQALA